MYRPTNRLQQQYQRPKQQQEDLQQQQIPRQKQYKYDVQFQQYPIQQQEYLQQQQIPLQKQYKYDLQQQPQENPKTYENQGDKNQDLKSNEQNDQILKCAYPQHQETIQVVVLDPNLIKSQRLLCKKCLENFETNQKTIGLQKVMGMTQENYKKKKEYREITFNQNVKELQELKQNFIQLKSYINKNLDEMIENTEIWMKNLNNYKLQDYNFHNEIDWLIKNNQQIEIEQLAQEIDSINQNQIAKLNVKLEQFFQFKEYSSCKNILNNLTPKKIRLQQQISNQEVISNDYAKQQNQGQQRNSQEVYYNQLIGFIKQ